MEDLDKMIQFLDSIMTGKGYASSSGGKSAEPMEKLKFIKFLENLWSVIEFPENGKRLNEAQRKQIFSKLIEILKNFKEQTESNNKGKK